MISWENVGWLVGSRVGGEIYGEWNAVGIVALNKMISLENVG